MAVKPDDVVQLRLNRSRTGMIEMEWSTSCYVKKTLTSVRARKGRFEYFILFDSFSSNMNLFTGLANIRIPDKYIDRSLILTITSSSYPKDGNSLKLSKSSGNPQMFCVQVKKRYRSSPMKVKGESNVIGRVR